MGDLLLSNSVYTAVYSGIPVYEMICRGIAVMRRHSDSWLNATQILKVAGVEKGRRTKILEREVLVGEHEKIQGGYGKYQGTWVPFTRGVELCRQYGVYEFIRPILEHDPTESGTRPDRTPTKAEVRKQMKNNQRQASRQAARLHATQQASTKRERNASNSAEPGSVAPKKYRVNSSVASSPLNSDINKYPTTSRPVYNTSVTAQQHNNALNLHQRVQRLNSATPLQQRDDFPNGMYSSPATRYANSELATNITPNWHQYTPAEEVSVSPQVNSELGPDASSTPLRTESDRNLLMKIFLNDDLLYVPDWLSQPSGAPADAIDSYNSSARNTTQTKVNVNLVIDEQGHTAVHWAAVLARINVLDLLLCHGADPQRLNFDGESALVRAVQVTNNYENQTFPDLLELLHDTIPLTDNKNRTVLHHISLTAGSEGHERAARYYAECLLSWIVRLAGGYQMDDTGELQNGLTTSLSGANNSTLGQQAIGPNAESQQSQLTLDGQVPTPAQSSSPNGRRGQYFSENTDSSTQKGTEGHVNSQNGDASTTQSQILDDSLLGKSQSTCNSNPQEVTGAAPFITPRRKQQISSVISSSVFRGQGPAECSSNADFAAFLNLQDCNGDTALNIAARFGDRAIVRILLGAGASATIPNRVGLSPLDFGVDKIAYLDEDYRLLQNNGVYNIQPTSRQTGAAQQMYREADQSITARESLDTASSPTQMHSALTVTPARHVEKNLFSSLVSTSNDKFNSSDYTENADVLNDMNTVDAGNDVWSPLSAQQRIHQSVLNIQQLMTELESDFAGEMSVKQTHFDGIKQQLRNTTIELAKARETIHQLHAKTSQLSNIKVRVSYLEDTLSRETIAVKEAISSLPADSQPRKDLESMLESLLSAPTPTKDQDIKSGLKLPQVPSFLEISGNDTCDESMLNELEKNPTKMREAVERLRTANKIYARRDALLRERVDALRKRADVSERERQYRQIIASCCEISETDVDVWIDKLVSAVESYSDPLNPNDNQTPVLALENQNKGGIVP